MDDEAWVERLRHVVATGVATGSETGSRSPVGQQTEPVIDLVVDALGDVPVANALRDLERRVAAVDIRLRQLNEQWDRLVTEVADAVVARLEERRRTLSG